MTAAPALDTYRPLLDQLDQRLAREIARLRIRYHLSLDEFRGLYVSDEQVDALLRPDPGGTTEIGGASPLAPMNDARWLHVATAFGLSALELDLLLVALAPEIDLKYETLYAYLNDDITRKWPTASLATRLLADSSAHTDVLAALAPRSSLRRAGLLEVIEPPAGRPSLLNAGFALSAPVSRFLQGIPTTAPQGDRDGDAHAAARAFGPELEDTLMRVAGLLRRRDPDAPAIVLLGAPGSGRMHAAETLAQALALPLRILDLRAMRPDGVSAPKEIAATALESALAPTVVAVCGIRGVSDNDGRLPQESHGVLASLDRRGSPLVVLAATGTPWRDLLGGRRTLVVDLTTGGARQHQRVWSEALTRAGLPLPEADCRLLADRFQFTPVQVAHAVATAADWRALGGSDGQADYALVRDAARAQAREPLGPLAHVDRGRFGWNDLVLPATVLSRLKELGSAIRLRHVVYGEWGFGDRFAGGRGVKAMFAGPSGTGKTMAASIVASESGLDLIKVDLSGLVSKYIGDTEKNLDRVFASARSGNALLFFDEADAIFGKRSEVKDAHDRYANIEVSYLLQKIEEHDGVVLLATNLRRNIDEAFSRRLQYVVDFPLPDAALRERLWRGMIPSNAPIAEDVDFSFVSQQFELAGGDIRNVILDAAFLAADAGSPIAMRHLVRALARQMAKQGRSPSGMEFQRYFEMVA